MRKIPLTQGKFAIVDDDDYEFLMQWKWSLTSHGYAKRSQRTGNQKCFYMHREITKIKKDMQVDHINHNKLDNRKCNLREVTSNQNMMNRSTTVGLSKYKGVGKHKCGKWRSYCNKKHIGLFDSEIEAAKAYDKKALELFGEHACLNFSYHK